MVINLIFQDCLIHIKLSQDKDSDFPPVFIQIIMNHVCHANQLFLLLYRLDLFSPFALISNSIIRSVSINIFILRFLGGDQTVIPRVS